ncbi:vWA domain-containing protein [Fuchsiella alkaliacetigena]|uniref:vWA domain-containing protein n=1 Tax=Fuchsiella alkaliacetigena TaxID=957042 RepID=UPI002009F447|nr:VWA domain-containing protein [Fuchsiella alkaliacetigena]
MSLIGGELSKRELHFFWIVDCSGSMSVSGKIQSLNNAIKEAIPEMREVARENPNAELKVRALKFSSGAEWHVAQATDIENFTWSDLKANGVTDLGKALSMLAEELKTSVMPKKGLPPVLVLLSDGQPTDDFEKGLAELESQPWGKKAVKIAIAIGDNADHEVLQRFIGNPEIEPLQADNSEELTAYIKWASTEVVKSASTGSSEVATEQNSNVPRPPVPQVTADDDLDPNIDVF